MKTGKLWAIVAVAVAGAVAFAASVDPILVDPWQSGDAASECGQTDCDGEFAHKFDDWDDVIPDGPYGTDGGNTITITDANDQTFAWESEYPVCAVIVKGGNPANIYYYDPPATSDTGLVAPINPNNDKNYDISHVTFCYDDPSECWQEETAWTAGSRYTARGNWATYTKYPGAGNSVAIYAGQTTNVGTATFSGPDGNGNITITINLTGAIFYYDENDPVNDHNLKVQDYKKAPSGNPAPGLFKWKASIPSGSTTGEITVPLNCFYGIHLDVAVPCE